MNTPAEAHKVVIKRAGRQLPDFLEVDVNGADSLEPPMRALFAIIYGSPRWLIVSQVVEKRFLA